ncbi:MAG: iron-containing redox enzyme family protein [Thermoleophilaceae bacterium]|nr:iron-containing redox enzyme family protein [Thermoleophilaceae bacterium]
MRLPAPRGPLSEWVIELLASDPAAEPPTPPVIEGDPLAGDDFHLALYVLHELHYSSWEGVSDGWEWNVGQLAFRQRLEAAFEGALRHAVPVPDAGAEGAGKRLTTLIAADDGPSLSHHLGSRATREQFLEFLVHRSAYQLKEADPYVWVIPRLRGGPKAALIEIEADEYGGGVESRMHSTMYADTLAAAGLAAEPNAYVELLPGVTLANVNVITMFGLQRRLRGAAIGHLAAFEMVSSQPSRRYSSGLSRLGFAPETTAFYDEHVEADSVHENIAAYDMAGGLARERPELEPDLLWGATTLLYLEGRFADRLLGCWELGESSLLGPVESLAPLPT